MLVARSEHQSKSTNQRKEDGESEHKQVAGGVEVDKLEVGQTHGGDHPEHDAEDAANYRARDGEEQGACNSSIYNYYGHSRGWLGLTELAEEPEHDHDGGAPLHHAPAAHLRHADGTDVLTVDIVDMVDIIDLPGT